MNPDMTQNLFRVHRAHEKEYRAIRDLMRATGRLQRPELVSYDCCVAADRALDRVNTDDEDLDIKVFREAKDRLRKRLKMTPHIALIIREALG